MLLLSAHNPCKQIGPRLGPAESQALSGSKLFDTDGISDRIFSKKLILKRSAEDKNVKNYPGCKELIIY